MSVRGAGSVVGGGVVVVGAAVGVAVVGAAVGVAVVGAAVGVECRRCSSWGSLSGHRQRGTGAAGLAAGHLLHERGGREPELGLARLECDTGTATQVRVPAVSVPLVDPVLVVWVAGRVFQVADSVQPDGAVKTSTTVLAVSVGVRHSLALVATDPAGTAGVRNASRPWVLPESQTTLELP